MTSRMRLGLGLLVAIGVAGCGTDKMPTPAVEDAPARAQRLAHQFVIVDTHIDVPYRLQKKMEDISLRTADGNFDYPRAQAGGLDGAFMSIYVPASYQKSGGAKAFADGLIDMVDGFATKWPEKFVLVTSPAEVRAAAAAGKVGLALGMENGAPVEDDLGNLAHFYQRGIRYITLTHSEDNQIGDSSYATTHTWHGLSPFGHQVVAEMNRLGIMVDISHVSDETFEAVVADSKAPLIASHSSCRAFTPGWERNMSDEMIRELAAKGGVIQINFGSDFLTAEALAYGTELRKLTKAFRAEHGIPEGEDNPEVDAFEDHYRAEHPFPYADVSNVVAAIDHVVKLVGVDHVGFGSDFDGVGDSLPTGLKDVSAYPNLIAKLLAAGYSEGDVEKICGGNLLRVWSEVERVAAELQAGG